ncbi:MAG: hypothetical protein LLG04_14240 [Parachlamydia sp.]|nr:hypothetical protein [Parachlamydia sp.]
MIRTLCLFLCLLGPMQSPLSAVVDESFATANQKIAEAAIYEVVEILNWKDCDYEGRTFKLNDGSSWYAVAGNTPLYSLVLGQKVVLIPMSDGEIAHRIL